MSAFRESGIRPLMGIAATFTLLGLGACAPDDTGTGRRVGMTNLPSEEAIEAALSTITEEEVRDHTRTLASDEFGGRAPSSPGEDRTMEYLAEQFGAMGLEPGGTD
ncbi:MAG: hypothetical protein PVJ04_08640, partial [Gemmatimonadota bacterium]